MDGIGPPLVTPFTADGDVDEPALRDLVSWVETRGVDFIVPCGSNSEAELMTVEERARVVDVVADEADVPVIAGTGHPGLRETVEQTRLAADAGVDAALVITPFFYGHDEATIEAYYRDVADAADVPIYLYNVPKFTNASLTPESVGRLAEHPNVVGLKDSSGDYESAVRYRHAVDDDFDLFVGNGSLLAPGLDAGADGGVLAVSNVAPEAAAEVYRLHRDGDADAARALNADLVELNRAVTASYGVPGLKAAMHARDAPVGYPRRPHREVGDEIREAIESLVANRPRVESS